VRPFISSAKTRHSVARQLPEGDAHGDSRDDRAGGMEGGLLESIRLLLTQLTRAPINQMTPEANETSIHALTRTRGVFSMRRGHCEIRTCRHAGNAPM